MSTPLQESENPPVPSGSPAFSTFQRLIVPSPAWQFAKPPEQSQAVRSGPRCIGESRNEHNQMLASGPNFAGQIAGQITAPASVLERASRHEMLAD
jgi:hypothetical protein